MKRLFFLFLCLTLSWPGPAFALRAPNPKNSPPLEQALTAGLEESGLEPDWKQYAGDVKSIFYPAAGTNISIIVWLLERLPSVEDVYLEDIAYGANPESLSHIHVVGQILKEHGIALNLTEARLKQFDKMGTLDVEMTYRNRKIILHFSRADALGPIAGPPADLTIVNFPGTSGELSMRTEFWRHVISRTRPRGLVFVRYAYLPSNKDRDGLQPLFMPEKLHHEEGYLWVFDIALYEKKPIEVPGSVNSTAGAEEAKYGRSGQVGLEEKVRGELERLRGEAERRVGVRVDPAWYRTDPLTQMATLANALLSHDNPASVKKEVQSLMRQMNHRILAPLLGSGPYQLVGPMEDFREMALALPVADDWLVYAYSPPDQSERSFERRTQALAVYSRRAAAEAFSRNGPHLRADFVSFDRHDIRTAPILLRGFLPYLQEMLTRVQKLREEGKPDLRLERRAGEYAGALFNGLMIPGEKNSWDPLPEYRHYFARWATGSNGRLRPTLALAVSLFPARFPDDPKSMPPFLRFANLQFAHQEIREMREFNRSHRGSPLTLWQLTTGTGRTEEYIRYLEKRKEVKPLSRHRGYLEKVYGYLLEESGVIPTHTAGAEESGEALAEEWIEFARKTEEKFLEFHGERWTRFVQTWSFLDRKRPLPGDPRAVLQMLIFPRQSQTVDYLALSQGLKGTEAGLRSGNLRRAWSWVTMSVAAISNLRSDVQRFIEETPSEELQEVALAVGAGQVPAYQWHLRLLEEELESWWERLGGENPSAGAEENAQKIVVVDSTWIEQEPRLEVLLSRVDQMPEYGRRVVILGNLPGKEWASFRTARTVEDFQAMLPALKEEYPFLRILFLGAGDLSFRLRLMVTGNPYRAGFDRPIFTPALALRLLLHQLKMPEDLAQELSVGLEEFELLATKA